jgi:hypothetical protein
LIGLALTIPGCADPVAPGAVAPATQTASASSLDPDAIITTTRRVVTTFPLQSGSFTLTFRLADGSVGTVKGTYTGTATASLPGNTTAVLDLQITETSGIGSAITSIEATGTGSFVDEGNFALTLTFRSSTSKALDGLKVTLRGTSRLSCSASHLIVVTEHGTQSTPKFVEITIDLQHLVGSGGC